MRGTLRQKKLKNGKLSLYIDYYPKVWNPYKQQYTRREFLDLHIHANPATSLEVQENKLYIEIAEEIYLKRMKTLMLDANGIFNKDALEADFYIYAHNFIKAKQKEKVDTTIEADLAQIKTLLTELSNITRVGFQYHSNESIMSAREVADFLKLDINIIYPKCTKGESLSSRWASSISLRRLKSWNG